jgi:hypothetical protein
MSIITINNNSTLINFFLRELVLMLFHVVWKQSVSNINKTLDEN